MNKKIRGKKFPSLPQKGKYMWEEMDREREERIRV
jgi:hypothetical protein